MNTITFIIIATSLLAVIHSLLWHDWATKQPTNGELNTLEKIERAFYKDKET